jgi:hypothetical protein
MRSRPMLLRSTGQDVARLSRLMQSRAVRSFWDCYHVLPTEVQRQALKQYRLWLQDPRHPSVHFKKVGGYWSARVNDDFRAVGILDGDTVIWFFIGTHDEYSRLLRRR